MIQIHVYILELAVLAIEHWPRNLVIVGFQGLLHCFFSKYCQYMLGCIIYMYIHVYTLPCLAFHSHTYIHACTCMQSAIEAFCNMNTFVCICPLALLRKNQRVVQNYYLRYLGGYDAQLMRDVVMVRE